MDFNRLMVIGPLMGRKLSDLTIDDLGHLQSALGLNIRITPELQNAALALLQGKSIDTVADLVQSPESVKQLVSLVKGEVKPEVQQAVVRCKHCSEFFLI